jgi:hypothetical protein
MIGSHRLGRCQGKGSISAQGRKDEECAENSHFLFLFPAEIRDMTSLNALSVEGWDMGQGLLFVRSGRRVAEGNTVGYCCGRHASMVVSRL